MYAYELFYCEVSKITGLTTHTLRYYDKEGLLPYVRKLKNGIREFSDDDLNRIKIIECLKSTRLQIKEIKKYIDLHEQVDKTLTERLSLFENQKQKVQEQINTLENCMEKINYKIKFFKSAMKYGLKNVFKNELNWKRNVKSSFSNQLCYLIDYL